MHRGVAGGSRVAVARCAELAHLARWEFMPPTNASVPAPAETRPAGSVWLGTLSTFRRGPSRRGCVGSGQVVGMGLHPLLSFPTRARRGGRRRPKGRRVFTGGRGVSPAREHLACRCRRARPQANAFTSAGQLPSPVPRAPYPWLAAAGKSEIQKFQT